MAAVRSSVSGSSRPVALATVAAGVLFVGAGLLRDYFYLVFGADVYLPLHTLLEIASVVVSFSIFALYWNASKETRDAQMAFIGAGFMAVAIIDSMHALSFPGMPDFVTPSSVDKGIWYFLAARLWAATVLLAAALVRPDSESAVLRRWPLLVLNLLVSAAVFVAVSYFPGSLPVMFVADRGLTPFKIGLEYLVVGVCALAAIIYIRSHRRTGSRFLELIAAAMIVTAFSELFFTLYGSAYDLFNLLGHMYKVVAYYLIFSALFVFGVQRPYRELQGLYDQIENRLKRTIAQLENSTLAEREARERAETAMARLQALQTVTEAALSNLALDALLQDLLDRISGALSADAAVLLLVADDGNDLIVRAESGESATRGDDRRVKFGQGIPGRIAASRQPSIVDDVSSQDSVNRLFQAPVRSLIGAPLVVEDRVIGVVQVGTATPHRFTEEDMHFLQLMAYRVSSAIERARMYAEMDTTISSIADGVIIFGRSGQVLRSNPAAEKMLGIHEQEAKPALEEQLRRVQMKSEDGIWLSAGDSPVDQALRGETARGIVTRLQLPDGRAIWISSSAAPIRTADGEQMGAVVVFSDVTRLRQLQEQREDLLRAVSHDMRTPLTAIQGHAELLMRTMRKGEWNERSERSATAIMQSTRQMNAMIQDLVESARLESGQMELHLTPVHLDSYLLDILDHLAGVLETSRVQLAVPGDLPPVCADPHRLERIVVNLVSNALKYSPRDSEVEIIAERSGEEVRISVADRGSGIPPEDLEHIFDRYYRAREKSIAEGLGLGLYITKMSVEAHGGHIWVDTDLGKGSTFHFTLPVATEGCHE